MYKIKTFVLLSCLLSGCNFAPHYAPPCVLVPEEWKNSEACYSELPDVCFWWQVFQDDTLDELEMAAVDNNPTLDGALHRIEEAWAVAGVSKADLFPQLNLAPGYSDTGQLFKIYLPQGASIVPGAPLTTPFRVHQYQYNFPVNLSYELDLWGKFRGQYEAAFKDAQAQQEAYRTAMLSLTADVANSYFSLRTLDTTIALLENTIDFRRKAYELTNSRFEKGLTTNLDVSNAATQLANTEAIYYDTVRQRGLQENILATLTGVPASDFCLEPLPLTHEPPAIPAGIPSGLLLQRPDIAQAERTVASQNERIGVAIASFFPSFDLTGTLGYSSPDLHDFFKWQSRLWSIGSAAGQTLFDGGRKGSDLDIAWARFGQASAAYRQQVLTAFQEVEDALNNLEYKAKQAQSLRLSAEAARKGALLSRQRYKQGMVNYFEVILNDTAQLDAESNYISAQGARYQSTILLIKALGDTWARD